ncbi:MAG TPA: chemotaxis protein CheB [Longimicrobiales bacterium]
MNTETPGYDLIAIGTSAGGFAAICTIVQLLPAEFQVPLAIVQHRARESEALAGLLQDCTPLTVLEVEDKQPIEAHSVYIAPPDYHLLIDEGSFSLSTEGPVGYSRPSIDVFFDSAADAYGSRVIGVVLTGANADGSRGLRTIAERGGRAIVQDPATAEVAVMPTSALQLVPTAVVLPLEGIVEHLLGLTQLHSSTASRQA